MVLEEATASTDGYPDARADDSSPPTDNDPFAAGPASSSVQPNWDELPKPVIFARAFAPYSQTLVERDMADILGLFRGPIQRPLSADETQRIVGHVATGWATATNITGCTTAIALAQCYRRAGEFRFPLISPRERWAAWFTPDRLGPLAGGRARLGWHVLRAAAYYGTAYLFAPTPSPKMWAVINMSNDPALKELKETVGKIVEDQRGPTGQSGTRRGPMAGAPPFPAQPQQQQQEQTLGGPSGALGAGDRGELAPGARPRPWGPQNRRTAPKEEEDDMSPTAGSAGFPYSSGGPASREESPIDAYTEPSRSTPSAGAWTQDADDASPVAQGSPGIPGESAWDRLRRERTGRSGGAASGNSGWGSNGSNGSQGGGSGW
jgi:hypothetical protein